jgi:hypothetical protein
MHHHLEAMRLKGWVVDRGGTQKRVEKDLVAT